MQNRLLGSRFGPQTDPRRDIGVLRDAQAPLGVCGREYGRETVQWCLKRLYRRKNWGAKIGGLGPDLDPQTGL